MISIKYKCCRGNENRPLIPLEPTSPMNFITHSILYTVSMWTGRLIYALKEGIFLDSVSDGCTWPAHLRVRAFELVYRHQAIHGDIVQHLHNHQSSSVIINMQRPCSRLCERGHRD